MQKFILYALIGICSAVGEWIPTLWHAGFASVQGIIGGIIGFAVGIWAYIKLRDYVED